MNVLFLGQIDRNNILGNLNYNYVVSLNSDKNINMISVVTETYKNDLSIFEFPTYHFTYTSKFDMKAIKTIRRISKKHKIDIIHAQTNRSLANAIWASYFLKKKPKIICKRGIIRKINKFDPGDWVTYLHPRLSHIISLSEAIKEDLIKNSSFPENKITTIYQAMELDWLKIDFEFNTRKMLNIPKDAIIIGTVANYRPVKGLDILISALKKMYSNKKIHCIIIGERCKENLEKLITNAELKKRVHFIGKHPKPGNYVKDFDIYVQPSRSEGLSLSLVEAMLLGICPVISNVGGMVELVPHKKRGLSFEKENIEQLINSLLFLINNQNDRLLYAKNAKEFAKINFLQERMTTKTIEIYNKVIKFKEQKGLLKH